MAASREFPLLAAFETCCDVRCFVAFGGKGTCQHNRPCPMTRLHAELLRISRRRRRDECQTCGATRMMRQRRRRWWSVRKSASIGVETAPAWPVDVPPELLPALGDGGFSCGSGDMGGLVISGG